MSKYSVHMFGAGGARDYVATDSLTESVELFRDFVDGTHSWDGAGMTVGAYDPRDNSYESHSGYPLHAYEVGPRGGIRRV